MCFGEAILTAFAGVVPTLHIVMCHLLYNWRFMYSTVFVGGEQKLSSDIPAKYMSPLFGSLR
jgi:hypothetical protein